LGVRGSLRKRHVRKFVLLNDQRGRKESAEKYSL
jgi:hypothetical protein